jgi:hypothetical protein
MGESVCDYTEEQEEDPSGNEIALYLDCGCGYMDIHVIK